VDPNRLAQPDFRGCCSSHGRQGVTVTTTPMPTLGFRL
jgi:hypothetical protein